jgi:hypothetical protein
MIPAMIASLRHFHGWMVTAFRSSEDLVLENLALRRQSLALHAQRANGMARIEQLFSKLDEKAIRGVIRQSLLVAQEVAASSPLSPFTDFGGAITSVSRVSAL